MPLFGVPEQVNEHAVMIMFAPVKATLADPEATGLTV